MADEKTLMAVPPAGDYVMAQTGLTWSISRSHGDGSGQVVSAADASEDAARSRLLSLATKDQVGAWEEVGKGLFRKI